MIGSGDVETLAGVVTGRTNSLFDEAMVDVRADLDQTYRGASVLVTGGAGFIGGQTLRTILPFGPRKVVVADISENALAELVRDLRGSGAVPSDVALEPRLVDVTGPMIERLCSDEGPFDALLGFAAAKHVRTERDPISVLQMLKVNVNGSIRCVRAVKRGNPRARVFMVSTDKAADPASLMGASKRLMEMAVLGEHPDTTVARFANVAFSSGSLLESWLIRLARRQALPVPANTERYFVSPRESGQLCAIASVAPPGSIVVPEATSVGSIDLLGALHRVLQHLGVRPWVIDDQATAQAVGELVPTEAGWPVLVTQRDTAGEKNAEVFVGRDESARAWIPALQRVKASTDTEAALAVAAWIDREFGALPGADLDEIVGQLGLAMPNLRHVRAQARLDDRV